MGNNTEVYMSSEEEVEALLEDWDIVICAGCGKEISLLDDLDISPDDDSILCKECRLTSNIFEEVF